MEPGRLAAPDPKYLKLTASSASESVMHRPGIGSYTGVATFVRDFRGEIYYQNTRHLIVKGDFSNRRCLSLPLNFQNVTLFCDYSNEKSFVCSFFFFFYNLSYVA